MRLRDNAFRLGRTGGVHEMCALLLMRVNEMGKFNLTRGAGKNNANAHYKLVSRRWPGEITIAHTNAATQKAEALVRLGVGRKCSKVKSRPQVAHTQRNGSRDFRAVRGVSSTCGRLRCSGLGGASRLAANISPQSREGVWRAAGEQREAI